MNRFWQLSLRARLMIVGLLGVAVALVATSAVPEMASTNASGASHRRAGREEKSRMRQVFPDSLRAR